MKRLSPLVAAALAGLLASGSNAATFGPAQSAAAAALSASEVAADAELQHRILLTPTPAAQTELCVALAWDQAAPNPALSAAALRWLRTSDPRLVATALGSQIGHVPPATNIAMIELLADIFHGLGGIDFSLNTLLAEQIRSRDPDVAHAAIQIAKRLQLREAYIPLREIASGAISPRTDEAIDVLSQIGDARAAGFLIKLLDNGATSRDTLYKGLERIGRGSALFLKLKLNDRDPAERQRALDALLPMATAEDLSALYQYIQKYPPEGAIRTRVYAAIATAEASQAQRPADDP